MGRQVVFHMLQQDQALFLASVRTSSAISIITRDSESEEVQSLPDIDITTGRTYCLWNAELLPNLRREWIPDPGYYKIDVLRTPVIEFLPSFAAPWESVPSLGAGRIYGNFDPYLGKPPAFDKWYESIARWIRSHHKRTPEASDSYVGSSALNFMREGGYLLPIIVPPRTEVWLKKLDEQHK